MYLQYSCPLIYHLLPNVWKASYTIRASIFVDILYRPSYSMDKFIYCVVPGSSHWFFQFGEEIVIAWTHRVNTVNVPKSPIDSSSRGQREQQRCDSLHCHEERRGSIPPRVVTCFTQSLKAFVYYDLAQLQFDPGMLL